MVRIGERMSENERFLIGDAGELIDLKNHKFIDYGDECCKLLNELHDENQLLHKINEDTIDFMYDNFDSNIMFTNRELNDICNEMGWELSEKGIKIKQLEKENEQLKKENYELHKRLGDFEPFEEHIKERTSKTSVNDIIGLVKTDEPIDIVELEKELKEFIRENLEITEIGSSEDIRFYLSLKKRESIE